MLGSLNFHDGQGFMAKKTLGILCGVGTRILKIGCLAAEIWAKQKFKCEVFYQHPLIRKENWKK